MILEDNEVLLGISKRRRSVDEKSRSEKRRSKKNDRRRKAKGRKGHKGNKKSRQNPTDAKGLALPVAIDGPVRFLSGASDVDCTYEEQTLHPSP